MVLRNHKYIVDGIAFNTPIFDKYGVDRKLEEVYTAWRRNSSSPSFDIIMSHDGSQYVPSKIVDVRVCGDLPMFNVYTESGRQFRTPLEASLVTEGGIPMVVRNIPIGTRLVTVDNYKNYHGDHIALRTDANSRVRALLRNHGIPFSISPTGSTQTERGNIWCAEYEVDGVLTHEGSNSITVGVNNWRTAIKQLFGLPETALDPVIKIVPARKKYAIGVYTEGPQNIVVGNGILVQSAQTEVRKDYEFRRGPITTRSKSSQEFNNRD
jgi:hypothetical protein